MKELTIEQKAKAYDEAINAIKELKENHPTAHVIKDWIKEKFPELAESEDERIRKRLIAMCQHYIECYALDPYNLDGYKKAIAWLEKQGEQKSANKVEPKFKVGDVITNKKSKDTVKIVQILHDSYCYSGWDGAATVHSDFSISEQDNWELAEQKPAEWSEEDEYLLDETIKHLEVLIRITKKQGSAYSDEIQYYQRDIDWLKSLRPKQGHIKINK